MQPLSIDEKGGVLIVKVVDSSAFNENQSGALRHDLYAAFESRPEPMLALDLSSVDYLSSSGIALLIGAKRRIDAAQGRLVLFDLDRDVLELFHSMKLTALFDIAQSEAEALTLFPSLPTS